MYSDSLDHLSALPRIPMTTGSLPLTAFEPEGFPSSDVEDDRGRAEIIVQSMIVPLQAADMRYRLRRSRRISKRAAQEELQT